MSNETPLLNEHRNLGASFTDFAGWQMPLKYGSELEEHHAVRHAAGLFDLSHMGEIEVAGRDAGAALDYALAGEMSAVGIGRAKYSLICGDDGGVLDDLVVYRLGENDYMVVANASNAATVFAEIDKRAAEFDVDVIDNSADTALLALQGPLASEILAPLLDDASRAGLPDLKYYACIAARAAGIDVVLGRTGYTGEDGFELYVDAPDASALWRTLLGATTAAGGRAAGLAARDTLRLEAGMALYGHELTADISPYEAGLGRTVALDKEFVGSQALAALSESPPAQRLVAMVGAGRRAARAGYSIQHNGSPVGVVTSGALSPTLGHPIALGYVEPELAEPGTDLSVDVRGNSLEFTVVKPPFYKRPRP